MQPFSYFGSMGWEGFDANLAREVASRLNLHLQAVPVGYDGFYDALATQQVDIAMSALMPDPARMADFVYSDPYFDAGLRLIEREHPSSRTPDLRGKRVAVALGSEADRLARYLERRVPGMSRAVVASDLEALNGIRMDTSDGAIIDGQLGIKEGCRALTDQQTVGALFCTPVQPLTYVIAMSREDQRLLAEVNRVLHEIESDGTIERLADKWFRQ